VKVEKAVLKALRHARRAMTPAEVREAMGEGGDVERVERVLQALERSGAAIERGGRYLALNERGLLVGRLSLNRRGYGFVSSPGGDVYVGARDIADAMHGDIVGVRPHARRAGRPGRSGEVVQVVERARDHVVGRLEVHGRVGIVVPTDPRIRSEVFVEAASLAGATSGDVVVARLTRYPTRRDAAQGVVDEVLGPPDAPGVGVEIVIREHGLRAAFPEEVEEAAGALTAPDVDAEVAAGRTDERERFTVTIDPVDAKDFDDAVSVTRSEGGFRLGVHIADVSRWVPWGSTIDAEALLRATSVYLVDRVLPMLPERLSNELCSLKPGEERLTMTVDMDIDRTGLVERYRLYPSVIRSDRRLDYDSVDAWLSTGDGFPDDATRALLTDLRDLAAALGKRRTARGGLDFETVEAKVRLDADGSPIDVVLRRRTTATNMIEEAMILANEVVARHMSGAEAPMMYRIHEAPDEDALDEVAVILKEFDYPITDIRGATPATFQRIVAFAHGRAEELLINSILLRALQRARYSEELGPHFGLASEAYTHFTSPIRRYPDLIVHRLLRAQLTRKLREEPVASMVPELHWLADHTSAMEREAEAAEEDSTRLKLAELMARHVGEEFDGVITGVTDFGIFVQLENTAEGLAHVRTMRDDYYRFEPERRMLVGEERGRVFRLGGTVRVRVAEVFVAERRIDFEVV